MVVVNWPVSESLQVWKPESDRGESRLGYQTSGPPKGGPVCLRGIVTELRRRSLDWAVGGLVPRLLEFLARSRESG